MSHDVNIDPQELENELKNISTLKIKKIGD